MDIKRRHVAIVGGVTFVSTLALLDRFKGPRAQLRKIADLHEEAIKVAGPQKDWLSWLEGVAADAAHPLHAQVLSAPVSIPELAERWFHADLLDLQGRLVRHADLLFPGSIDWADELVRIAQDRKHLLYPDWIPLSELCSEGDLIESLQQLTQLLREEKLKARLPESILPLSRAYWRWCIG